MNNFQEELNLALKNIQENQKEKAEEIFKKILSKDKKFEVHFFFEIFIRKKNYQLSKKYLITQFQSTLIFLRHIIV